MSTQNEMDEGQRDKGQQYEQRTSQIFRDRLERKVRPVDH